MRAISARSLLLAHFASFSLLCLGGAFGYGIILILIRMFSDADLAQIHQQLGSSSSFHNVFGASITALAAIGGGWVAAATSNAKPLVHGALSGIVFFVLLLLDLVSNLTLEELVARMHSPLTISELIFPLFGIFGAYLMILTKSQRSNRSELI